METLAYSQLVLTYEDALDPALAAQERDRAIAVQLHQQLLLKRSQTCIFALGAILGILGTATQAFALLKQGDSGPQVTRLQERLQSLDYFDEKATGYFGEITAGAVKRFQRDRNLDADGVVGPSTEAQLFERSNSPFNEDSFLSNSATQTPIAPSDSFTSDPFTSDRDAAEAPRETRKSRLGDRQIERAKILRLGDRGEQVKQLQSQLRDRGFSPGEIDGIYGRQTRRAIMQFQRSERLSIDGIAGRQTLSALDLTDSSSQRLYNVKVKSS